MARYLISPPHRDGGQTQYIARPMLRLMGSLVELRAWLMDNLGQECTLIGLARQASVSVRTLTRRFQKGTGQSLVAWLTAQRIAAAQERLGFTDEPVATTAAIAAHLGCGSVESMRQFSITR